MKKSLLVAGLLFGSTILFTGCTYKAGSASMNQDFYKQAKNLKDKKYTEMGIVSVVENGWLFSSCDSMGSESLQKLENKAKGLGADAVINVSWRGDGGSQTVYPQCHTAWGWVLLWPAWFIPGTSDTVISGTMIKYE